MHTRRRAGHYAAALAGSLMLAGTLTGVTRPGPADAAVAVCQWTEGMQPPRLSTDASFKSVAVPSASQAWAVGTTTDSRRATHALIERWNGSAWATVPVPRLRASSLVSIRSASPTSIWAVGTVLNAKHNERTLILHWNGKAWAQQPSPNPGSSFDGLSGVRVVSATNAWAVGDFSNGGTEFSLILHWNGTAWKQVNSPNPTADNHLAAVAATSATNAWAVGLVSVNTAGPRQPGPEMRLAASADPSTFILHWNGRKWSRVASPSPGSSDFLAAVGATSASNAWAVGATGLGGIDQTLILHWNGRTWKPVPSPDPDGSSNTHLAGVTATSASNAWAVGGSPGGPAFILQWNGHRWQPIAHQLVVNTNLNGVAASSAGNAWAVGDVLDGTVTRALAWHCM